MTSRRIKILEEITSQLKSGKVRTIVLSGAFGSGKSEFIEELKSEIMKENLTDAFLNFNTGTRKNFLVDFVLDNELVFVSDDTSPVNFELAESLFNKKRFYELIEQIDKDDNSANSNFIKSLKLKRFEEITNLMTDEIGTVLEKNSDKKLILMNGRTVAESLVVDLLNLICPLDSHNDCYAKLQNRIKKPFSITIVIDNIDSAAFSIISWLNDEFLNVCLNFKLKDFICFGYDESDSDIAISDLIEFRFIISSRIRPQDIEIFGNFNSDNKTQCFVELALFDESETEEYVKSNYTGHSGISDVIHEYSFGLPYLIDIICQNTADEIHEVSRDNAYHVFASKYLDLDDEIMSEAMRFGAVFCRMNLNAVECNKKLKSDGLRIFERLKFLNDTFDVDGDMIVMKDPIRSVLLKSLERNNKSVVLEFRYIQRIINSVYDKVGFLNDEELRIIRGLAYFKNFDLTDAIDKAFDDKANAARSFVSAHNELFIKNRKTYSVAIEYQNLLSDFNRILEPDKYTLKLQMIESFWTDRKSNLMNERGKLSENIDQMTVEHKNLIENPSKFKEDYDSHQRQFIENENELIRFKKSLNTFSLKPHFSSFLVNFIAGILSFGIAGILPVIFTVPEQQTSFELISYVLYGVSAVFLIISMGFSVKMMKIASKSKDKKRIMKKIQKMEEENISHQNEMNNLRDISLNGQKQAKELSERINTDKMKMSEIQDFLNEPYI